MYYIPDIGMHTYPYGKIATYRTDMRLGKLAYKFLTNSLIAHPHHAAAARVLQGCVSLLYPKPKLPWAPSGMEAPTPS